jgi:hypothetical protein
MIGRDKIALNTVESWEHLAADSVIETEVAYEIPREAD